MSPKGLFISRSPTKSHELLIYSIRAELHSQSNLIYSRFVVTTWSEVLANCFLTPEQWDGGFQPHYGHGCKYASFSALVLSFIRKSLAMGESFMQEDLQCDHK